MLLLLIFWAGLKVGRRFQNSFKPGSVTRSFSHMNRTPAVGFSRRTETTSLARCQTRTRVHWFVLTPSGRSRTGTVVVQSGVDGNDSLARHPVARCHGDGRIFQPLQLLLLVPLRTRTRPEGVCVCVCVCKSPTNKQAGWGGDEACSVHAEGLLPPAEWGSAEPAGVSAVSSSAGLIPRHSIEAPVITKARPVARVG